MLGDGVTLEPMAAFVARRRSVAGQPPDIIKATIPGENSSDRS